MAAYAVFFIQNADQESVSVKKKVKTPSSVASVRLAKATSPMQRFATPTPTRTSIKKVAGASPSFKVMATSGKDRHEKVSLSCKRPAEARTETPPVSAIKPIYIDMRPLSNKAVTTGDTSLLSLASDTPADRKVKPIKKLVKASGSLPHTPIVSKEERIIGSSAHKINLGANSTKPRPSSAPRIRG